MSSNIEVQRICQYCGIEFTARTTVTKFCSHRCGSLANKAKKRAEKMQKSNTETKQIKNKPIEELKVKEFLTVREVAQLLNCSVRSTYYYIEAGTIKAVNLGQRMTRIRRSEIDKLFEQPQNPTPPPENQPENQLAVSDCYTLSEVQAKYNISEKGLYDLISRNNVPKIKKGRFAYVPKTVIDKLLS